MNIWDALGSFESSITDKTLRIAWLRMVETRNPADCKWVQDITGEVADAGVYWSLAYAAEEFAEAEQEFAHKLIKATVILKVKK